jgi:hypothetical protein
VKDYESCGRVSLRLPALFSLRLCVKLVVTLTQPNHFTPLNQSRICLPTVSALGSS